MQGHKRGGPWQHWWAAVRPHACGMQCVLAKLAVPTAPHSSNDWHILPSNWLLLLLVASRLTADAEPGLAEHKVRAACTFPGNVKAGLSGNNAGGADWFGALPAAGKSCTSSLSLHHATDMLSCDRTTLTST